MHRGKGIRVRRRIGVAAGAAVMVAAAAVLPGVLRTPAAHPTPISRLHYTVTVRPPAKGAPAGTIAQGITDGKNWRLVLSGSRGNLTVQAEGQLSNPADLADLFSATDMGPGSSPANLAGESSPAGPHNYEMLFGTLRADVARIEIRLPDGQVANLMPVRWAGYRWVGIVLPAGVRIAKAVAYDTAGAEVAYAIPHAVTELSTWWAPRQAGPARVTKSIGAGTVGNVHWHVTAEIGPWGYCYAWANGDSGCSSSNSNPEVVPGGKMISYFSCSPLGNPSGGPDVAIAFAARAVRTVVLRYSDGSSASFPTVWVSGGRVFAYVIPKHVHVTSSRELGATGQVVGATSAAGWRC
jgi:hypothetical protein